MLTRRKKINKVIVLSVSLIFAAVGIAFIALTRAAEPNLSQANIWVDSNGGSCTRTATAGGYVDTAACGSLQTAWSLAQDGDVIIIKNNSSSYGDQSTSGDKNGTVSVYGESKSGVKFSSLNTSGSNLYMSNLTVDTGTTKAKGWNNSSSNVTLDGVDLLGDYIVNRIDGDASAHVTSINNVTYKNGNAGTPGRVGGKRTCNSTPQDNEPFWVEDATNVTFDNINFSAFGSDPTPCPSSYNGFHLETIRVDYGAHNLTIKNSYFAPGSEDGSGRVFITQYSGGSSSGAPKNFVFQNNIVHEVDGFFSIQINSVVTTCSNYVIAYNTFVQEVSIPCDASTWRWIGNLGPKPSSTCYGTYIKNVWQHNVNTSCGSDTWVNGPAYSLSAAGLDSDLRLTAQSPALNKAEPPGTSDYCTHELGAVDIDKQLRPSGIACDAGADEFATSSPPTAKPGDLNSDGKVDITDLSTLLSNYGKTGAGDINSSGQVDIFDLSILLSNYGK